MPAALDESPDAEMMDTEENHETPPSDHVDDNHMVLNDGDKDQTPNEDVGMTAEVNGVKTSDGNAPLENGT